VEKHLARVQARICAAGDHPVEITSASGVSWRRALEREGRALASVMQHTRPSMRKMVTAGCPDGPGRRPVARAWLSTHLDSAVAAGGGLLRCNSGQDGRTGTLFGCVRLDTATKVQSLQGCSAAPSGCPCALPNDGGGLQASVGAAVGVKAWTLRCGSHCARALPIKSR